MKIIHVLCEGQTEQGFVDNVLKPYLRIESDVVLKSILATTNKKKKANLIDTISPLPAGMSQQRQEWISFASNVDI